MGLIFSHRQSEAEYASGVSGPPWGISHSSLSNSSLHPIILSSLTKICVGADIYQVVWEISSEFGTFLFYNGGNVILDGSLSAYHRLLVLIIDAACVDAVIGLLCRLSAELRKTERF